ncbi:MAG: SMP-30/gluconolactonase/LRE family protein [Proteobacteria bacterium]|nr:SMP-30/gluconolactonase/LRE family protein [Pseudomonadota bacterium]MBU1649527.1 SMP-30/gluconolactonase/LRE family protein [Pseudomonadota bacterium]
MNKKNFLIRATFIVFLLAITLGLNGCMSPNIEPVPPAVDLVWPTNGETPRIRFINSVSRPEDFQITSSALMRFWNYVIGKEDDTLVAPFGLTVDSAGRMYVVDTFQRRIQLFDMTAGEFSVFPDDDRPMSSPIGIVVDKNGRIYVTDSQDAIIKVFDDAGDTSPLTIGDDLFQRPTGIAINPTNNELLVVDTKLAQIFRFDLHNLKLKGTFGTKGVEAGQFNNPTNIAVTGDGNILITDSLNFRIQIFSAQGAFQRTFGSAGNSPGHFSRARGVATDSDGNIYVVDALFDNIQIFNKTGQLLMDFGSTGQEHGKFWMPAGIWIDRNDKIYVADSYNKRVQIFQYLKQDEALQ